MCAGAGVRVRACWRRIVASLGGVKREPPVVDDNKRRLVILPWMPPADEPVNNVRYVGAMSDGKHVYENLPKKPRLFHQGSLNFQW